MERIFESTTEQLEEVLNYIKTFFDGKKVESRTINAILVSTEEIFINIVNYAYGNDIGKVIIKIEFENDIVNITFIDSGIKFNPLEKDDPDIDLPILKRQIGGLGIYMVKNMMDNIKYDYIDNSNVLTISKKIK